MATDSVTVEGGAPGGFWGKISGLTAGLLWEAIVLALIGVLFYMVWTGDRERANFRADMYRLMAENDTYNKQLMANQTIILRSVADVGEEQRVMTYVLTLSEAERKKLNLVMPKSLRERVK